MAIIKQTKQPRGYTVQDVKYLELSEGVQPPLEAIPAPYLATIEEDKYMESFYVVDAGQIVAFDQTLLGSEGTPTTNHKWVVPANGGTHQQIVYATNDVSQVVDLDSYISNPADPSAVAATKTTTGYVAANFPAGFAPYKYYTSAAQLIYRNFNLQSRVGFICDYFSEIPLIHDTGSSGTPSGQSQATVDTGHLLMAGPLGWAVKWISGSSSVEQIVGRCVRADAIAVTDSLDKVLTVPGLKLPGTATSGRQLHENVYLYGTTTLVSRKAKINITLL